MTHMCAGMHRQTVCIAVGYLIILGNIGICVQMELLWPPIFHFFDGLNPLYMISP